MSHGFVPAPGRTDTTTDETDCTRIGNPVIPGCRSLRASAGLRRGGFQPRRRPGCGRRPQPRPRVRRLQQGRGPARPAAATAHHLVIRWDPCAQAARLVTAAPGRSQTRSTGGLPVAVADPADLSAARDRGRADPRRFGRGGPTAAVPGTGTRRSVGAVEPAGTRSVALDQIHGAESHCCPTDKTALAQDRTVPGTGSARTPQICEGEGARP